MDDKGKKALMLMGLGVGVSASAVLLYYLLRRDESETQDNLRGPFGAISTSQQATSKVHVPRDMVGVIIGRQGVTIKGLQEKTNTRIRFDDEGPLPDDAETRSLIIRGSASDVQEAHSLINEILYEQPKVLCEEIFIPVRACGRIIGRNGESIRSMCAQSQAKILVDRGGDERDPDNTKRVTIRGTKQQIDMAISLIDEKLAEEEAFRQKVALSVSSRNPRYSAPQKMMIKMADDEPSNKTKPKVVREQLIPNINDGYIDVFVSSVSDPSQFWVQLVGTRSIDLDKLVEEMTDFYEIEANQTVQRLENPVMDELVAAPFDQDESWYRARVTNIEQDDYCPTEAQVTLYYEDFGETCVVDKSQLCQLLPQWSSLPYQAVECRLAHTKGTQPNGGWSPQAIETFKELTYAAQWQVILARPVSKPATNHEGPYQVILIDTKGEKDVNIAHELINKNLAVAVTNENDEEETQNPDTLMPVGTLY